MNIKIHYTIFCLIFITLFSCKKKKDLGTLLNINKHTQFNHSKVIRDVKNNFEITIGDTWKRELYFDDYQSRIYAADTTRNYSSSFIIDITRFKGKIILDKAFKNELLTNIEKAPKNYMISNGFLQFNKQPAYYVFSFERQHQKEIYTLDYYIEDDEYYYLLRSTINTSKNLPNSLDESVTIFNSLKTL